MVHCMDMGITWTTAGVQAGIWVAAGVMALIALYHLIIIASDLRKIIRRAERLTDEVESIVEKPLALTDRLLRWAIHAVEHKTHAQKHHKKGHSSPKKKD